MSRFGARLATAGAALVLAGGGILAAGGPASAGAGGGVDLIGTGGEGDSLFAFNSADPSEVTEVPVQSPEGSFLLGVATRPATQALYGLFILSDEVTLGVATIDPATGAVGTVQTLTSGQPATTLVVSDDFGAVGLDFNPAADRLRVIFDNDTNLRINVDTGATIVDGNLSGITIEDRQDAVAAAYTPVDGDGTELYDVLDSSQGTPEEDLLVRQEPNTGVLEEVGALEIESLGDAGFAITTTGEAFLAARTPDEQIGLSARPKGGGPSSVRLYTVDLSTGAADLVGPIGDGTLGEFESLTVRPAQVPPATTTTTVAGATTSTTAAVSPTTVVLARTGDEETAQSLLGVGLLAVGGAALVVAARLRRRAA